MTSHLRSWVLIEGQQWRWDTLADLLALLIKHQPTERVLPICQGNPYGLMFPRPHAWLHLDETGRHGIFKDHP